MHDLTLLCPLLIQLLYFLSPANAQASTYWVANIPRQGKIAFGNQSYPVFRNVKDYGAKGDGKTDDTAAIQSAVSFPYNRCGGGNLTFGQFCGSSTTQPAMVYFPPGTYVVNKPIVMYYFTQMVGDAVTLPTIYVNSTYVKSGGISVFDANIYYGDKVTWYDNQNNFYRQIRNFNFDMRNGPLDISAIHWQVAQATHINNVNIMMIPKTVANNKQTGIFMENGSGGFFSDVNVTGGAIGMYLGSQQFTTRNLRFDGCGTAIGMSFDWLWTYAQLYITNCDIGLDLTAGGFNNMNDGSVVIIDSYISATQGILSLYAPGYSSPQAAGTLVLERVDFRDSATAIAAAAGTASRVILTGGQYVELFAQGNAWTTAGQALNGQAFNGTTCTYDNSSQNINTAQEITIQRILAPIPRPSNLVDAKGNYVGRQKPQYETVPLSGFLSAKTFGLVGDGAADDSDKMQQFFNTAAANGQVAYFDRGAFLVSKTINVPPNLHITGECLSIIMATGPFFGDQLNPKPMWKIGNPGDVGTVEISDLVFETQGPAPGAIIIEWNIKAAGPALAGMWDAHYRIGGSAGTQLQVNKCLKHPEIPITASSQIIKDCAGAFLLLHVTPEADGYFENVWGWVADHELDMVPRDQVTIFNGRGALIESKNGPVWMWGTAFEHSVMYDYQLANAKNVFMGHIQHETAYYQGNPNALLPFTPQASFSDPGFADCVNANCARTWGLRFVNSSQIFVYSAGLYNFFENWNAPSCLGTESCQERMVDFRNSTDIYIWALNTKGSQYMVSYEGTSLVPYAVNRANFCACAVLFELAKDQ